SETHLRKLAQLAAKKKTQFPVNGTTTRNPRTQTSFKNESDVYRRLGMQFIPPELREDEGEIEAAVRKKLPDDLVTTEDIRGMVHCHTTYSDGKHSVEQMV